MKFNFNSFFKSKQDKEIHPITEDYDNLGFTKIELEEYDKNVKFYHINILNSLILYTYNVEKLDKMTPILIDPLTELYEELDYAFLPVLFETVFRNKLLDESFKEELLLFKKKVDDIPVELWDWELLDTNEIWIKIRIDAENILNKLNIKTRIYNADYTTIISNTGKKINFK
ncbi:hypothetical protein [Chryseobacterium balustinum]|uniref:Uncharacterized protein n=1 Tax=Chryseobacterium balustinum TaxID=246 RepID=A0AAX2IPQ9_9FLAO|nr:hypothetical protein [Chryseobacterium balustinum]AZB29571.1 hypothetical protein EB354_10075 [Chryseobacterium balustinum]SKB72523.1 hypothetical protein SAMN05421800_1071 [Chryseobacterium balustinum]SQA92001.1 Uncharacterised protein [Chryseobacterium balustinum]